VREGDPDSKIPPWKTPNCKIRYKIVLMFIEKVSLRAIFLCLFFSMSGSPTKLDFVLDSLILTENKPNFLQQAIVKIT
jgi:hypothetical protein